MRWPWLWPSGALSGATRILENYVDVTPSNAPAPLLSLRGLEDSAIVAAGLRRCAAAWAPNLEVTPAS